MNKPFCKITIKDLLDELHEREGVEVGGMAKRWGDWHVVCDVNEMFETSLLAGGCEEEDGMGSTYLTQAVPFLKHVDTLM
jgi:hypothetical protein